MRTFICLFLFIVFYTLYPDDMNILYIFILGIATAIASSQDLKELTK